MRLYFEVARRGYRRWATYRGATVAGVFTNTVFGFIRAYVFVALFAAGRNINGYDLTDALTYTFVGQALLMTMFLWGWTAIADRVRTGDIATDLFRPFDFQMYWLAQDYGRALYHFIFRGLPPFAFGALYFGVRLPERLTTWPAFVAAVWLGVTVSFAMRFLVNVSAFWLLDVRGVHTLAATAWTLLSGFVVPVAFFPDALRTVAGLLPFVALLEVPVNVFLERVSGAELVGALSLQAAWAAALLGAGRLVLARATTKVVIQGG